MKNKIAEFLDQNVWDGDKVSNSDSLMKVSGHKAYFNPHELHELVCDCLENVIEEPKKDWIGNDHITIFTEGKAE